MNQNHFGSGDNVGGDKYQAVVKVDKNNEEREKDKEHIVLLIHGIRTTAEWAQSIKTILRKSENITDVYPIGYGFFDVLRFLFPIGTRAKPIATVTRKVNEVRGKHPDAKISVLAHSFGTYIVSKILDNNSFIDFHYVSLCGSIIDYEYDWGKASKQITGGIVVNDCGTQDYYPIWAKTFTAGYGVSGRIGFSSGFVEDRFHDFGHSDFLTDDFAKKYWEPYFSNGEIVPIEYNDDNKIKPLPWFFKLLTVVKIWWFIILPLLWIMIL